MANVSIVDWMIWAIYFVLIFLVLFIYKSAKRDALYKYFMWGYLAKCFGGVLFVLIYVYYYGFGDTFLYNRGANVLAQLMIDSPLDYIRLLGSGNGNLPLDLGEIENAISYSRGAEEWFMVKLLSPISLISFQSYLVTTLFMSLISFFGAWKLFKVLNDLLPEKRYFTFFAAFLIPSALFWGGGIMKDTFTLAGINIIIYCLYFTVFKQQISFRKYALATVATVTVFYLKGYIFLAFIPGLLFGINALIKHKITNSVLRKSLSGIFIIVTINIFYFGPRILSGGSSKYQVESLRGRVRGFHTWHSDIGGSTYNLGEIEYTALGVVRKIPASLNVTFFRPYLWEAGNIVVLIAALESIVLLFLFIYVAFRLRLKIITLLGEHPILITFVFYCLVFGFVVGFTSYNFGALGRYKIPIYSLFVFILLYLLSKTQKEKTSIV